MRKKIVALLMCGLLFAMTGCSSGISQEEYDEVVQERDELKEQIEISDSRTEFEKTYSECSAKIESEYEHAEFIFYVARSISENGMDEVEQSVESVYSEVKSLIDNYYELTTLADDSGAADTELFEEGAENIQNSYDTWNETYQAVIEMENFIKEQ